MFKYLLKISFVFFMAVLLSCSNEDQKDKEKRSNNAYLIMAIASSNDQTFEKRQACAEAILALNQCIPSGYGYEGGIMCTTAQLNAFSQSDYVELKNCANTRAQTTSCYLDGNKAANAQVASGASYFGSCNKISTSDASLSILKATALN